MGSEQYITNCTEKQHGNYHDNATVLPNCPQYDGSMHDYVFQSVLLLDIFMTLGYAEFCSGVKKAIMTK